MFILKNLILNVKSFDVGQNLYYADEGEHLVMFNGNSVYDPIFNFGAVYSIEDIVLFQSYNGCILIFNSELKDLIYSNRNESFKLFLNPTNILLDHTGFYATRVTDSLERFGVFNLQLKAFYEASDSGGQVLIEKNIMLKFTNNKVSCFSLGKNAETWQNSIDNDYTNILGEKKIDKILSCTGCYSHDLWFNLESGNSISFDAASGVQTNLISFDEVESFCFPYEIKKGSHLPYGDRLQLDESKGELFYLQSHYFTCTDLNEEKIRRKYINIEKTMKLHDMEADCGDCPFDEDYIYFCDRRKGKIGVFERKTLEVIWSHELEIEKTGIALIREMKYANNCWYILDRNNTLHVFEKTTI